MEANNPIQMLSTVSTGQDFRGLVEVQHICLKYAKPNEVTSRCLKPGLALLYPETVILKRDNNLMSWDPQSYVMYNFTNDKCSKFWVVKNKLGSLCAESMNRKLVLFNPETLELNVTASNMAFMLDPERTAFRNDRVEAVDFLMLSLEISDDFNRRGVSRSLLYVYMDKVLDSAKVSPHVQPKELLLTEVQQADQTIEAKYNASNGNFTVLINSLVTGYYKIFKFVSR